MNKIEKMKLGRRKSYLERCIVAINLLREYETGETIRYRIFKKHIAPVIKVSYQSFNNIVLSLNAAFRSL